MLTKSGVSRGEGCTAEHAEAYCVIFLLSLCPTPSRLLIFRPRPSREARIFDDSNGFWTMLFPEAQLHNDFQGVGPVRCRKARNDANSRNQAYPGLCRACVATGQYSVNKFIEICPAKRPKSSDFGLSNPAPLCASRPSAQATLLKPH